MKIIDKYIVARYISRLIWAIIAATIVFLVIDIVENLDKFIDANVPAVSVLRYYYLFIPYIVYLILPVATLLATLFTIGGFTVTNELMAMHVQGISFMRPLSLLLISACAAAFGAFFIGESIIPHANHERMDIYRYEVKRLPRESRAKYGKLYLQLDKGRQLHINRYNPVTREAFGIEIVDVDNGRLLQRTDAMKMVWINEKWNLQEPVTLSFLEDNQVEQVLGSENTIAGDGLHPDEFEKVQTKPEEMNYKELSNFISKLQIAGSNTLKWEVDLLFKISLPVAAIVIVLFGAPVAAIRRRGGTALGFGIALFICFIYFGFIQVGKVMGYKGILSPLMSAWIGNFFFGILGLSVLRKWAR